MTLDVIPVLLNTGRVLLNDRRVLLVLVPVRLFAHPLLYLPYPLHLPYPPYGLALSAATCSSIHFLKSASLWIVTKPRMRKWPRPHSCEQAIS
jgi:hypothetical protein